LKFRIFVRTFRNGQLNQIHSSAQLFRNKFRSRVSCEFHRGPIRARCVSLAANRPAEQPLFDHPDHLPTFPHFDSSKFLRLYHLRTLYTNQHHQKLRIPSIFISLRTLAKTTGDGITRPDKNPEPSALLPCHCLAFATFPPLAVPCMRQRSHASSSTHSGR